MIHEFKATHRYDGADNGAVCFDVNEEVMFIRPTNEAEDGFSPRFVKQNGLYMDARGTHQYVLYSCMEAI